MIKKLAFYIIIFVLVAAIVWYIASATVPFATHKGVSSDTKTSFSPESCYSSTAGTERVMAVSDSQDALLWRFKLIDSAEKEIVYTTFDFRADNSGTAVMAYLLSAAERGVKVSILIDGYNFLLKLQNDDNIKALAQNDNVEIKLYNSPKLLDPEKLQLRMHDKYMIIDGDTYMIGGRNTNDLFLGKYSDNMNTDMELVVYETSPNPESSINQLKDYFNSVWSLSCCQQFTYDGSSSDVSSAGENLRSLYKSMGSIYEDTLEDMDIMASSVETNKITLLSNPVEAENKEPVLWYKICQLIKNGQKAIIKTPYIICSDEMYADLKELCADTRSVSIITNSVESGVNIFGCADYLNEKDRILETGVTVYELSDQQPNHTKSIIIDDRLCLVGSYNLDMRSTYLDTELMLAVDSPDLASILGAAAENDIDSSRVTKSDGSYEYGVYYKESELPFLKKVLYAILRVVIRPIRFLL